jgi:AcrR family transcriptional regulator
MERAKKECILAAATRAFARFGFKKASVEEIARDAGVAKGTVYLACDTKEDLFYQSVHREVRAWTAEVAKLIDPRQPADQLLVLCAEASLRYLQERPLVKDLVFGQQHMVLPDWADRLDELRDLGRVNIVEILRLGKRQGVFRADLDVEHTSQLLEDLLVATYTFHMRGENLEARVHARMLAAFEMVFNGLRPRAAASALPKAVGS